MPTLPRLKKPHLPALLHRRRTERRGSRDESASSMAGPSTSFDKDVVMDATRRILHGLNGSFSPHAAVSISCAYHVETMSDNGTTGSTLKGALSVDSGGKETEIPLDCRFGYGSFQKTIQGVALFKIIEEGTTCLPNGRPLPVGVRNIVRKSWNKPAVQVLNELRVFRDENCTPWPEPRRMPTIQAVLTHCYAFTTSQRYFFAPDGTFLLDEDTLGETFARLTDEDPTDDAKAYQYNNLNAIIAGLIIKYAMGRSLAEALWILVLDPLKMYDTIVDIDTFEKNKTSIQPPFVTTFDGSYETASELYYLHDDVEFAAGGGYTSAGDIAKLLSYIMEALSDDESAKYKRFFSSEHKMANVEDVRGSYLSGYCANLDSEAFGNQSSECVDPPYPEHYRLGKRNGKSVRAVWKAGAVKGYSCHYYMIPAMRLFLIVFCNSSGIVDPAHHVARHLLQVVLNLDKQDAIDLQAPEIVSRQKQAVKERTAGLLDHLTIKAEERASLKGTYVDEKSQQRLVVEADGDELAAHLIGNGLLSGKRTSRMRLFKFMGQRLALQPISSLSTSLDFYHAWRDFALEIIWDGDTVHALRGVSASSTAPIVKDPKAECEFLYVRQPDRR